ncbi:hypothetical protein MKW92_018160, partial [Papaver armeniacum]
TLCPEPHDNENDKRLDKKKVQDLRKALQEELRASVRHIAFLTSMLGKLDGLLFEQCLLVLRTLTRFYQLICD